MTTVSAGVRDDLRRYVSDEALPKRVVYNPIDIEGIERAAQQAAGARDPEGPPSRKGTDLSCGNGAVCGAEGLV